MPPVTLNKAVGLNTQPNELDTPAGSLAVAENVVITRDGVIEVDRGFEDYSANLPDFTPAQLLSVGGVAYLHLDNGIWYNSGGTWYRKRGVFGQALIDPYGCCYLNGHLYVTTASNVIFDINLSTGARTILAGRFGAANAHTDGTGDAARFGGPVGICTDGTSLYVCEQNNHGIRKVTTAGVVTSLAGSATNVNAHTDGTGNLARFDTPVAITWDGSNLYVSDKNNNCIRKVTTGGVVTTPYGVAAPATTNGHTDNTGNAARFDAPYGITNDGTNLYVCDGNNNCVRKIVISSGSVTTPYGVAAPATTNGHADGTGNSARFDLPFGIAYISGVLYVAENNNNCIRKIVVSSGDVTTPFGTAAPGTTSGSSDGAGNGALFTNPLHVTHDGVSLYVCDFGNDAIRKAYIDSSLYVTTIDGISGISAASSGIPLTCGILVGPS